jgi:ATP-dependent Clp protease ATP-binding subunit ClpA
MRRYENLGRLGTIVPFLPLQSIGRRRVVERQLRNVGERLRVAKAAASLAGWSDGLLAHTLSQWDDDLGGRSTRDFIEETVVEAIAEALDGAEGEQGELEGEPLPLRLDVQPDDGHGQRVVCTPP